MLEQTVDGWVRRWKRDGMRAGHEEGLKEGLKKGRIELLESLLTRRFGEPLPDWVQPRLKAAAIAQLDDWARGIFDAGSLDELLGPC